MDFSTFSEPYFVNIDDDEFRTKRFVYVLSRGKNLTFGPDGDVRPPSFSVKKSHCSVAVADDVTLHGGEGLTLVSGANIAKGQSKILQSGDWVVMGKETLQFFVPGVDVPERDLEDIFAEISTCLSQTQAAPAGANDELARRIRELEAQNTQLQASQQSAPAKGGAPAAEAEGGPKQANLLRRGRGDERD